MTGSLEVLIEHSDEHPEVVGHYALIELRNCSIWWAADDELTAVGRLSRNRRECGFLYVH